MFTKVSEMDAPRTSTLAERVAAFIDQRGGHFGGQIRVTEHDGAIVLEGVVGRYHDRQIALICAKHCAGVRHIIDRIVVRPPATGSRSSET